MTRVLLAVGVAFVVSTVVGGLATRLGPRLGWLDEPDDPTLKAHLRPAVPLGGVGLWLGVTLAAAMAGVLTVGLAAASLMLLLLGLIDDRLSLSPPLRLTVAVGAGLVLGTESGWPEGLLVAGLVVLAVNAVNLFDGLDGLAGGSGLVAAAGTAALALGRGSNPTFSLLVVAGLAGFLVWNWHPARLFLGDNGAYVLSILLVSGFAQASPNPATLLIAAALLGVFLFDLAATLWRRIQGRQPLFAGDRDHLYDRLARAGWPIPAIALAAATLELIWAGFVAVIDRTLLPGASVAMLLGVAVLVVIALRKALAVLAAGEAPGTTTPWHRH